MTSKEVTEVAELEAGPKVEMVEVEHKGVKYSIEKPDMNDPPVDLMEAIEDEKSAAAVHALMGDVQWRKFKQTKPKASDLNKIVSAVIGTQLGNSDS